MVFDLIVSALVTVLVVMLTDGILTFFGNGLMNIGYRSAWIGPGGLRPSVRTMILTAAALLSFCLTFYFLMRETIRYIGKILEKVKEISAGDFDHPIEVKGNDEFSVMAENLNTMRRVLIKFCPRCHRRHPLNSRQKQNQQQNTGQTADFASSFPVHRFSSSFFPFGIPTGSSTSKTVPCRSLFTRTCP